MKFNCVSDRQTLHFLAQNFSHSPNLNWSNTRSMAANRLR